MEPQPRTLPKGSHFEPLSPSFISKVLAFVLFRVRRQRVRKFSKALRRWNNCLSLPAKVRRNTVGYGNGLVYLFPGHLRGLDFC